MRRDDDDDDDHDDDHGDDAVCVDCVSCLDDNERGGVPADWIIINGIRQLDWMVRGFSDCLDGEG